MPSWTAKGPISLNGSVAAPSERDLAAGAPKAVKLVVVDALEGQDDGFSPALLHPADAAALLGRDDGAAPLLFLTPSGGGDTVLAARPAAAGAPTPPRGRIALSAAQQVYVRLAPGCAAEFSVFRPPAGEPTALAELEIEVSALGGEGEGEGEAPEVDAAALAARLGRALCGRWLARNELLSLPWGGGGAGGEAAAPARRLLLRVAAAETLGAAERAEAVGYWSFRGVLTPDTQIYLSAAGGAESGSAAGSGTRGGGAAPQSAALARPPVRLVGARPRPPPGAPADGVDVHTSDGERFLVPRRVLRPCIKLTAAVRAAAERPAVRVDVDTATFDRALLFLEAEFLGRPPPEFAVHHAPALAAAAAALGARALADAAAAKLGAAAARRRLHGFDEIQRRNAAGEALLVLDGMVLDITRWLPEHPGGDTIIPEQGLNLDCARMFEVYHASRESFAYLAEFYAGEVAPEDAARVPRPPDEPSPEFLAALRAACCGFRLEGWAGSDAPFKSF